MIQSGLSGLVVLVQQFYTHAYTHTHTSKETHANDNMAVCQSGMLCATQGQEPEWLQVILVVSCPWYTYTLACVYECPCIHFRTHCKVHHYHDLTAVCRSSHFKKKWNQFWTVSLENTANNGVKRVIVNISILFSRILWVAEFIQSTWDWIWKTRWREKQDNRAAFDIISRSSV